MLLTGLAVFLGVALMSGTYVLTDTIDSSFEQIFEESNKGSDVTVVPRETVDAQGGADPPAFSEDVLEKVRAVDGVGRAEGAISSAGAAIFIDGERAGSEQAPGLVSTAIPGEFQTLEYSEGRPPRNAREAAIDGFTARSNGIEIGDRLQIAGETAARRYRVVGFAGLGGVDSFGGATLSVFTLAEAQRVTGKRGKLDIVVVDAADGVSPQELKRRVAEVVPGNVEVRTGEENAAAQADDIQGDLGFLQTALLVFSGIALFVGAFIIFNTFSITVAQRTREFGVLRTIGASQQQVLVSVVVEALVIGLVASALGMLAGLGFAPLINAIFKAADIDLPNTGTVVENRTVIVSILVGTLVTVASSLVPAIRATRVSPMDALRESTVAPQRKRRRGVNALAWVLLGAGILTGCIGLFGDTGSGDAAAGLIGLGAVLMFLGVALLSPRVVRPIAAIAGRPLERRGGITGRLARENAIRNPSRTAVTAAALMIGLALVTFVSVFAAGIRTSIDKTIDETFTGADLVLQHQNAFDLLPREIGPAVERVRGVRTVSGISFGEAKVEQTGDQSFVTAVDPRRILEVIDIDWKDGSDERLRGFRRDDVAIDDAWASGKDIEVGDTLTVTTPTTAVKRYRVVASIEDKADFFGDFVLTREAFVEDFDEPRAFATFVAFEDGVDRDAVREEIDALVARDFPIADVLDQGELKEKQGDQIDQLVNLLYALLSLALIVSLFGIVNTLTLSIYERTRELGLLRAIGMSQAQTRRVVRYEAVITAAIGAVLGSALGIFFAILVSRPLADQGFSLSFPIVSLVVLFLLALLAGVVAAILPARRAARLDTLEALAYE